MTTQINLLPEMPPMGPRLIEISSRVRVTHDELTCQECGETFPASWSGCPRCTDHEPDRSSGHGSRYRRTPHRADAGLSA